MNLFKRIFGHKPQINKDFSVEPKSSASTQTPEERFAAMSSDERLKAIMSLGDTGQVKFYDLLKYSILSDPDKDVRFAALKRIHLFKEHPDLVPFLQDLQLSKKNKGLEPYLSMALSHVGLITQDELQNRINGG